MIRHAPLLPVCVLGGPGRGLWTAAGPVEFARGVDDCSRVRLAVARPGVTSHGHTGPATGRVIATSHGTVRPFPLTVRGLGKGVDSLGGVAWITQRQFLPPGIAATLGRGWNLPPQLWVAPFLGSRPLCQTLPGCSSACWGPLRGGMRLWGLVFGCWCHWCRGAAWPCHSGDISSPCCLFVCECDCSGWGDSRWCCLCEPVDMSALGSLPTKIGAAGARLEGRDPVRVGSVARIGPLPLLTLPVRTVRLPPLLLCLRMQLRGLVQCLLSAVDVLTWVVVALRVTAHHLTITALSLALQDWVRVRGQ